MFKILFLLILCWVVWAKPTKYTADWKSLDSRPLPQWYDKSKIGIFIHWGVFSVPAFGDYIHAAEWFWWYWKGAPIRGFEKYMQQNYPPNYQYSNFAGGFTAKLFNATQWTQLFEQSGAKYVVLTSKHHEGFCNWNTSLSFNWNSCDNGPNRDLVGELAGAIRKSSNLTFGLYHSMFEWFNPLYLLDKKNKFKTDNFVRAKTLPELFEIVYKYKPEVIWSDGDWEPTDAYWKSREYLQWLYNDSPVKTTVVVNDRWGSGTACKHGGFYTCQDRYNPGKLVNHKWENCFTLDRYSWGFRREMKLNDVLSNMEIIKEIVTSVSCGGNVLVNIGPTAEGVIPLVFQERLLMMGAWLRRYGEAIYETIPWKFQNDSISQRVWYTAKAKVVYATILSPYSSIVKLGNVIMNKETALTNKIELIKFGKLNFTSLENSTIITMPPFQLSFINYGWSLKITGAL